MEEEEEAPAPKVPPTQPDAPRKEHVNVVFIGHVGQFIHLVTFMSLFVLFRSNTLLKMFLGLLNDWQDVCDFFLENVLGKYRHFFQRLSGIMMKVPNCTQVMVQLSEKRKSLNLNLRVFVLLFQMQASPLLGDRSCE